MDTAGNLRGDRGAGLGDTDDAAICTLDGTDGVAVCTFGGTGGVAVYTLGDYWWPDSDERTEIGDLIHQAKDQSDSGAASELAERFAGLARDLTASDGDLPRLVTPVPSGPAVDGNDDRPHLAELLARSLATAGAGEYQPGLVVKSSPTPRLRHINPERRAEVAASAGYKVHEPVVGRHIVVVDDVVLTGTTLGAVITCLQDAGAESVTAAVAARTRLR